VRHHRLNIVVPYRDRQEHLWKFIPHLRAYLANKGIEYSITIVEQEPGLPFNMGILKNIGFTLGVDQGDYTCFHDVDYLPLNADYSWTNRPTVLVWYGAERRPVRVGRPEMVTHDMAQFYGGAILAPNDIFMKMNGYSNDYWGWGFEDLDFKTRGIVLGISFGRRQGRFEALDHDNEGFMPGGRMTEFGIRNQALFERIWSTPHSTKSGLSTLTFEKVGEVELSSEPPLCRKVSVRIKNG
jgi:N-terminal region of glycosyl transferase group 7/N-terminal domain of galactosyltransferase